MGTKAEMIAKQQAVYTANPAITDWAEVEETLHTDPASMLESFYGSPVSDSNTLQTHTTSNLNFIYGVSFSKVGRHVYVHGTFINISGSNQLFNTLVFALKAGEYACTTDALKNQSVAQGAHGTIGVTMSSAGLRIQNTVLAAEIFYFSIIYNTLD